MIKKILKAFEWAIIAFLCFCLLYIMTQIFLKHEPSLFGYRLYTVLTDSMQGTIDQGSIILSKEIKDPMMVKEGDIITFKAPSGFDSKDLLEGQNITHRVIEGPYLGEDGNWYIRTKGDNAESEDLVPIPVENIQAKVVASSKILTKLMSFLSKWYGFVIVIVIPLLTVLVLQVRALIKEKTRVEEENMVKEKEKNIEDEIKKKAIEEYIEQHKEDN